MKFTDGPLNKLILSWIEEFRKSNFDFGSWDSQLAEFLTKKLQTNRNPVILNPKEQLTWKRCYLCGTPMNPKYDPSGGATCGGNCCGR